MFDYQQIRALFIDIDAEARAKQAEIGPAQKLIATFGVILLRTQTCVLAVEVGERVAAGNVLHLDMRKAKPGKGAVKLALAVFQNICV